MKTKEFLDFLDDKNIPYDYVTSNKIEVFLGKYLAYDSNGNTSNIFLDGVFNYKIPVENFIRKYEKYEIEKVMQIITTEYDKIYYFYSDGENYKDLDNNILCKSESYGTNSEESKRDIVSYFKKYR